jgi:hypothetical protein
MRKILLASTALVALTSVSAMAEVDGITGTYEFGYEDISGDGVVTDGTSYKTEANVDIKFSATADNGLTATFIYGLDDADGTETVDDASASLSGDFGKLLFINGTLDDDAVLGTKTDVDGATSEEITPAAAGAGGGTVAWDGQFASTNGTSVSYTLPAMVDGLTVAIAHSNQSNDIENMAYGAKFTTDVGGAALSVSAASTSRENGTAEDDYTHYGLSIASSGFTIMLESNSRDNGTGTGRGSDMSSSGVGATYAMGNVTLGAYQRNAETGLATDDYSQTAFGVDYTIAAGITASVTSTSTDIDSTTNVDALRASLKLSF